MLAGTSAAQVPTPEAFFGFKMGADGKLADWASIQKYFETVAAASPRVELVDVGPDHRGPAHHRRHHQLGREHQEPVEPADRQPAARRPAPAGETKRETQAILTGAKAVVAIGCSIHASEIGATQSANDLLYELATANDARTVAMLDRIVVILMPSLNPDGHRW